MTWQRGDSGVYGKVIKHWGIFGDQRFFVLFDSDAVFRRVGLLRRLEEKISWNIRLILKLM